MKTLSFRMILCVAAILNAAAEAFINRHPSFTGATSQRPWQLSMSGTWMTKRPDAPDVTFIQSGAGAMQRTVRDKLNEVVNVSDYGVSASSADNAAFIQAAEDACFLTGGGTLNFPPGILISGQIVKRSKCRWVGAGFNRTVLKAKSGINTDFVIGESAASLWGTLSTSGIAFWGISSMTIDGNRSNNTAGSCLFVYGYRYELINMQVQHCAEHGIRTGYGSSPSTPDTQMDAYWQNVSVLDVGKHGVWDTGPHDSYLSKVHIIDASQAADNMYYGFFNEYGGNARIVGMHVWQSSNTRPKYAMYDKGALNVTASHFEGARSGAVYIAGPSFYDASNWYYAVFDTVVGAMITFDGAGSASAIVKGHFDTSGTQTGVKFQNGAGSVIVELTGGGGSGPMVDLTGSGGSKRITMTAFVIGGPGVAGTPDATDTLNLDISGASASPANYFGLGLTSSSLRIGTTTTFGSLEFNPNIGLNVSWPFYPNTNNALNLGDPSYRWLNGYFDAVNVVSASAPTGSGDAAGAIGDMRVNGQYIYYKTGKGWLRFSGSTF